jgi:hypothetical protein
MAFGMGDRLVHGVKWEMDGKRVTDAVDET